MVRIVQEASSQKDIYGEGNLQETYYAVSHDNQTTILYRDLLTWETSLWCDKYSYETGTSPGFKWNVSMFTKQCRFQWELHTNTVIKPRMTCTYEVMAYSYSWSMCDRYGTFSLKSETALSFLTVSCSVTYYSLENYWFQEDWYRQQETQSSRDHRSRQGQSCNWSEEEHHQIGSDRLVEEIASKLEYSIAML